MIKFYFAPAPNPLKVALLLEELGLPYEVVPVDTRKGEQHTPAFKALNPNAKTPALEDGEAKVFDSNAILLYLAEKTGRFLGDNTPVARGELFSWLMFVATGIGPYSGQAVHFKHVAPEPKEYPQKRYNFEADRHWGVLNEHLAKRRYMVADTYTIVDMAVWGWARAIHQGAAGRGARRGYQGALPVEDGKRRGVAPSHVSNSRGHGGQSVMP
jgi:GSH-dependent disulfide-bond oxidoreductase